INLFRLRVENVPATGHDRKRARVAPRPAWRAGKWRRATMRFLTVCASILGVAFMVFASAGSANAQATRTWVSGVGDDANPCSRTAPCKTYAGAISKTAAGGEINVLDPGGFGAVT